MSRDNLRNKQTIIIHNCLINDEKYDLVITPLRQTIGYTRTKLQTLRKKITNKQKKVLGNDFQNEETSVILNLMSFKNLGNKQTIVLHNCEIDNKKYDLVITPHTQTVGYIRTKRQTLKRKIINKQRQITRKRFSKNRNAFSESEASN